MAFYNTRNFSWSETEIMAAGQLLTSVVGVGWEPSQEKEYIYGAGSNPHDIKSGNKAYSGTLNLQQDALERLLDAAPGGDLLRLRFDVQVSFMNEYGTVVNYSLLAAEFTSVPRNIAQNDKVMQVELPFLFLEERRVS